MDVLITGGAGQLGLALRALDWPEGVTLHAPDRSALDLENPATIDAFMRSRPWAAVVNAAAYTAVDKAESEPERAWAANALAPARMAEAAARAGAAFIHVSTDYVFSGEKDGFYDEDNAIAPASVYGASKAAGEIAVRAAHPNALIVRTAWVFSARRANFLLTMLRLAHERPSLRVVDDQLGCPTSADDLAGALQAIALRHAAQRDTPGGIVHAVNDGACSWRGFAEAILDEAARHGAPRPPIEAIATADYPTPARRPRNSRLSTARLSRDYGIELPPWPEAMKAAVAEAMRRRREGEWEWA